MDSMAHGWPEASGFVVGLELVMLGPRGRRTDNVVQPNSHTRPESTQVKYLLASIIVLSVDKVFVELGSSFDREMVDELYGVECDHRQRRC